MFHSPDRRRIRESLVSYREMRESLVSYGVDIEVQSY